MNLYASLYSLCMYTRYNYSVCTHKCRTIQLNWAGMELEEVMNAAIGVPTGGDTEEENKGWKIRPGSTSSGDDSQCVAKDDLCMESASDLPSETISPSNLPQLAVSDVLPEVVEDLETDTKKKEKEQAEIDRLQTELQKVTDEKCTLEEQNDEDVEGGCNSLDGGGDLRRRDDEIKCLQGEIITTKQNVQRPRLQLVEDDALKKLETKWCLLESENQQLRTQMVNINYHMLVATIASFPLPLLPL